MEQLPIQRRIPDPRIDKLTESVGALATQIEALGKKVDELAKRPQPIPPPDLTWLSEKLDALINRPVIDPSTLRAVTERLAAVEAAVALVASYGPPQSVSVDSRAIVEAVIRIENAVIGQLNEIHGTIHRLGETDAHMVQALDTIYKAVNATRK